MRKLAIILLLAIFSIGLVACSDSDDKDEPNETDSGQEVEKEKTKEDEDSEESGSTSSDALAIGEKADIDDLEIEVTTVEKYEGSDFNIAENDYYLIVTLTVENNGDEVANVSSIGNVKFLDGEGEEYSIALIVGEDIEVIDGEVGPGEKKVGHIVYDVKATDQYELNYADIISAKEAKWIIRADQIK